MTSASVKIRGKEYKINPFSDYHISTLAKLEKDNGNLQYQFDAAFVLKEIILPDLPYDIIRKTSDDKYIFMIHAREIASVISEIIKYYYESEVARNKAEGNIALAAQFETNLAEYNKDLLLEGKDTSDKDLEIAKLKAQLMEKEAKTIDVTASPDVRDDEISRLKAQLAEKSEVA